MNATIVDLWTTRLIQNEIGNEISPDGIRAEKREENAEE